MNEFDLFLGELLEFYAFDGDLFRSSSIESSTGEAEEDSKVGLYPLLSSSPTLVANSIEGVFEDSLEFGFLFLSTNVRVLLLH